MTELTLGEFTSVLNYLIDNNHKLIDNGDTPISVCLEGDAGLGKTSVVKQLADAKGMTFVKINLAQIEEPAELIGFPYKEFKIIDDNGEHWVSAEILQSLSNYVPTTESRMSYAVPSWVPSEFNPNGTILLLDDFSRANSLIIQAVMEIINTGSYLSWKLPKYTNVCLTSNPDNGQFNVLSLDNAVKSRMITFNGKFDIKEWAQWAENFGIDGRAINFALLYETELFQPQNNVILANARNYTTFCRAISSLENWGSSESLSMILQIASGCFLEKENILGSLFTTFINNRLDKLISPDEMVNGSWDKVSTKLQESIYEGDNFKANVASILGLRFLNYCNRHLGTDRAPSNVVEQRITDLLTSETQLFSKDILYHIVKVLCKQHVAKTNKWFLNKHIREIAL